MFCLFDHPQQINIVGYMKCFLCLCHACNLIGNLLGVQHVHVTEGLIWFIAVRAWTNSLEVHLRSSFSIYMTKKHGKDDAEVDGLLTYAFIILILLERDHLGESLQSNLMFA